MFNSKFITLLVIIGFFGLIFLSFNTVQAGSGFGVGYQLLYPYYGITGVYDFSEKLTVHSLLGSGTKGGLSIINRGIYRYIIDDTVWNPYAYFGLGITTLLDEGNDFNQLFGIGVEFDWYLTGKQMGMDMDKFFEMVPFSEYIEEIHHMIELGYLISDEKVYGSTFMLGIGTIYRF